MSRNFRFDINGLRAWAVISVLLFHFRVPGFDGGFVGVDVFFVISGFLMTGIIVTNLRDNKFSIIDFYKARARRLMPALLALCLSLLIFGWFWLPNVDFKQLGFHAFTSVSFISNFKFWREAGYFDASSHEKWLLHTWSLSVEWQFFIILPIILYLSWKLVNNKGVIGALLVIFASSLAVSFYASPKWASSSYYLLHTRAWELISGGIVWWFTRNWKTPNKADRIFEWTGFALIITSILAFESKMAWPSYTAAVPVLGTAMVLMSNIQNSILTKNHLAQWIGSRSYSIYLWHWPICVFIYYADKSHSFTWIAAGIFITLLIGHISYKYIENYSRYKLSTLSRRKELFVITSVTIIVAAISILVRYQFIHSGASESINLVMNESVNVSPRQVECHRKSSGAASPSCVFGGSNIAAIVVGDSHADAIKTAVQDSLPSEELGVLGWTRDACVTILGAKRIDGKQNCDKFNEWVIDSLADYDKNIPVVIINRTTLASHGGYSTSDLEPVMNKPFVFFDTKVSQSGSVFLETFKENLINTTCKIARQRPTYLLRPIPEMPVNVPKTMARDMMFGRTTPDISVSISDYQKRHAFILKAQDEAANKCGAKILDPTPYLCKDGRCISSINGRPIYIDDDHLSEFGNKLLTPLFEGIFRNNQELIAKDIESDKL